MEGPKVWKDGNSEHLEISFLPLGGVPWSRWCANRSGELIVTDDAEPDTHLERKLNENTVCSSPS